MVENSYKFCNSQNKLKGLKKKRVLHYMFSPNNVMTEPIFKHYKVLCRTRINNMTKILIP